jgi:hypothetical protein
MGNGVDCICMDQDRMHWLSCLYVAMNLMFHNCWGGFFKPVCQENIALFI